MGQEPKYWRIRMTFGTGGEDVSEPAWDSNKVGIWYGGWSAEEFGHALSMATQVQQREWLSSSTVQNTLWPLSPSDFSTCLRFNNISDSDWVYVYFNEALHFAQVEGPMQTDNSPTFNLPSSSHPDGPHELFKYRRIRNKKSFQLGLLPTSFLILRSAGRSNVYEHNNSYWHLVKILAECKDEAEVCKRFQSLSPANWLEWASDKTWEAICEGYLILERGFVPTDLRVGGTMAVLDIVGYSRESTRILAQCKKHPNPVSIDDSFISLCATFRNPKELFYFAFGGVTKPSADVRIVDGTFMQSWLETNPNGSLYRKLLGLA